MALEPLAGYPPLPLRARVSVSCTDPGPWPSARLFPSDGGTAAAGGGQRYESDVRARRGNRRAQGHDCAARRPAVFPVQPGGIRRVFLGLMPYLELKSEGNHSMVRREALYRIPCLT